MMEDKDGTYKQICQTSTLAEKNSFTVQSFEHLGYDIIYYNFFLDFNWPIATATSLTLKTSTFPKILLTLCISIGGLYWVKKNLLSILL